MILKHGVVLCPACNGELLCGGIGGDAITDMMCKACKKVHYDVSLLDLDAWFHDKVRRQADVISGKSVDLAMDMTFIEWFLLPLITKQMLGLKILY